MDTHNYSTPTIILTDYDERYTPSEEAKALRVALVDDIIFFTLGRHTEERGKDRIEWDEDTQAIGVDAGALVDALVLLIRREQRRKLEHAQ